MTCHEQGGGLSNKSMKAYILHDVGNAELGDLPLPRLSNPNDAILKVTASTICGSDVHFRNHGVPGLKPDIVLGHEFVGVIVELGQNVRDLKVGDRVAAACATWCGECFFCRHGQYVSCTAGHVFGYDLHDGCQAEYCRVPNAQRTLYKIPEDLSDESVLFVGDILSTGYYACEMAGIQSGDQLLVIGAGPVGMCSMLCAKLWGTAQIIAVDINQSRLDVCQRKGLADIIINPGENDHIADTIRMLTNGLGADAVIEASGLRTAIDLSLDAVRKNGTVSIISLVGEPYPLNLFNVFMKNVTLKTGLVNVNHIPKLIKLIQHQKLNTDFLITHRSPLNDIERGYDVFSNKKDGCIKWVLTPYVRGREE